MVRCRRYALSYRAGGLLPGVPATTTTVTALGSLPMLTDPSDEVDPSTRWCCAELARPLFIPHQPVHAYLQGWTLTKRCVPSPRRWKRSRTGGKLSAGGARWACSHACNQVIARACVDTRTHRSGRSQRKTLSRSAAPCQCRTLPTSWPRRHARTPMHPEHARPHARTHRLIRCSARCRRRATARTRMARSIPCRHAR